MENNKENNVNVNEAAENQNQQPQEQKNEKAKEKEKVTWSLGPVHVDLNPKVAKVFKAVGIGVAVIGTGLIGSKIGGARKGKEDGAVIDGQAAEISRLNALLDEAPKMIESTAETVAEVIPDVEETISEE